jgi:hypothetical protein
MTKLTCARALIKVNGRRRIEWKRYGRIVKVVWWYRPGREMIVAFA